MASHPHERPGQVSDLTLTPAAGFVPLYPPYSGALYPLGRAEGRSPSALLIIPPLPKGDTGGLARRMKCGGWPVPTLRLDSCFRSNDTGVLTQSTPILYHSTDERQEAPGLGQQARARSPGAPGPHPAGDGRPTGHTPADHQRVGDRHVPAPRCIVYATHHGGRESGFRIHGRRTWQECEQEACLGCSDISRQSRTMPYLVEQTVSHKVDILTASTIRFAQPQ